MSQIIKAAAFARQVHHGRFRKDFLPKRAYFSHVAHVAGKVAGWASEYEFGDDLVAAAYLHDTVEDCKVTFQQITELFGAQVSLFVYFLTNWSDMEVVIGNRETKKAANRAHLSAAPRAVQRIKLEDRVCNLEDILASIDYQKAGWVDVYCQETIDLLGVIGPSDLETSAYLWELVKQVLGTNEANRYNRQVDAGERKEKDFEGLRNYFDILKLRPPILVGPDPLTYFGSDLQLDVEK